MANHQPKILKCIMISALAKLLIGYAPSFVAPITDVKTRSRRPRVVRLQSPRQEFHSTMSDRRGVLTGAQGTFSTHQSGALPFPLDAVNEAFDLNDYAYLELESGTAVYDYARAFVKKHGTVSSLRYAPCASPPETIGLGLFPFSWDGHKLYALNQRIGQPVGTGCEVAFFTNLVLFAPASEPDVLVKFCKMLVDENERAEANSVNVYEWNAASEYWHLHANSKARPMDSVVLPTQSKKRLLNDVEDFLAPDTKKWYEEHGIPRKRGYLFFGQPGSGKTTLIQAIAGLYEHNICHIHLANPLLTDVSLRAAVNSAPKPSILVIEDIDAMFGQDREKLMKEVPLTFSGLLNSLDGIGKTDGQIFILTANHPERLNPALIRHGRADVHFEFGFATDEQIVSMFRRFYPSSASSLAQSFATSLREALAGKEISTAVLQHFFILHRKSSAPVAAAAAADVVAELDWRATEHQLKETELEEAKRQKEKENNA